MTKTATLICAITWLLIAVPVRAAILYVDNSRGCPGNGSSSSPYCSIQNALNNVQAGDTIRIRTGTGVYSGVNAVSGKNGTAQNPIIIEPDSGAHFVLRNTSMGAWQASLRIKESDHWMVRNLVFDADGVFPSLVALHIQCETKNCVGIRIEGNTFRNWRQQSGASVGPAVVAVQGCDTRLGCPQNRTIEAVIENNRFENLDRLALIMNRTINSVVRKNEIRNIRCGRADDTAANALGIFLTYGNTNLEIYDNHIHDFVSKNNCPLSNGGHATTAGIWADVCAAGVSDQNVTVYRNVIYNLDAGDGSTNMPNGGLSHRSHGVFVEQGCAGWRVHNNVIYNIGNHGIRNSFHSFNSNQTPNLYYNNTIYNVRQFAFWIREGIAVLKNNIFRTPGGSIQAYIEVWDPSLVKLTADYNLYDDSTKVGRWGGSSTLSLTNWHTACKCDGNSIAGNPQFANESSADFRLQASSPARGAGEAGVDIGAYPYSGAISGQGPEAPANLRVIVQ